MQQNQITIQIKDNKPKVNPNMVALKKIQHFSYVMSDQIGLGFSSKVFKGKNDQTNQIVAVKVIQLKNVEEVQFLNDQVVALERIKKANPIHLLKLEGVFKTKNNLYIITQFCEGKDLGKILRKKKQFNEHEAQSILKQLLKGYKQLYELQVVHRDLKLANIFVKNGQIKIADFGFAVAAETCDKKSDFNVGSPTYMSPQALKNNMYSYASDVWAIGIMAYQLIYGRPPWKDRNDAVLYDIMCNTPIDNLFSQEFPISQAYKTFIRKCLTVNIKQRAKPEYIINFQWKLASDFISGMDRIDGKPVTTFQLPQNNTPTIRQIRSNNNIQLGNINKQPRRNTVFQMGSEKVQNKSSRNASINKLENVVRTPKQSGNAIPQYSSQIYQSENNMGQILKRIPSRDDIKVSQSNLAFSDNIAKRLKSLNNIQQNKIMAAQNMIVTDSFPNKKDLTRCENAILSQIHYCRFLNMLYDQINMKSDLFPSKQAKEKIVFLLLIKVKKLTEMVSQRKNIFELPYFTHYLEDKNWKKIKDTILQYQHKFQEKYSPFNNPFKMEKMQYQEPIHQLRDIIKNAIIFLRPKMHIQTRLVEMLTNCYQLLDLHEKTIAINFGQVSKIQYLISKQHYENIDTHRLANRLQCLGL